MLHPLRLIDRDPWAVLQFVLGEPLHPGGDGATEDLLDRAELGAGDRLLDVGCGAGSALAIARARGALPVGLDRRAGDPVSVRGDLGALPIDTGTVDVVLAECVLCLASDAVSAAREVERVLGPAGRLAISDLIVEGSPPTLPEPMERVLCLSGSRSRVDLMQALRQAGFTIHEPRDHRDDLLAMRDRAATRVDYEGLLSNLGDQGRAILDGIHRLESAIESGEIGYVSAIARPKPE